jgi:hypothetical protein
MFLEGGRTAIGREGEEASQRLTFLLMEEGHFWEEVTNIGDEIEDEDEED